jgi:MarR family 2-MHQ and catechol resistance regulon transcriptional repressor
MAIKDDLRGVHLWLLLYRASHSVGAAARRSVEALGLCLSDFGVLEALLHKGPLAVGALGEKVLLTSGSMTAAVDRLEQRGLVRRSEGRPDRRARLVELTAEGQTLIRPLFARHTRDMERVFAVLNDAERQALAAALRKLGLKGATE